jgi:hypothetical protein
MEPEVVYISSENSFQPHPETKYLAVYCSDRNFRQAQEEFLGTLEAYGVDRIIEPGGSKIFITDPLAIGRLEFLIDNHGVREIFLIGHNNCGAYRAEIPQADEQLLEDEVKSDLEKAKNIISDKLKQIKVECVYARSVKDRVKFEKV